MPVSSYNHLTVGGAVCVCAMITQSENTAWKQIVPISSTYIQGSSFRKIDQACDCSHLGVVIIPHLLSGRSGSFLFGDVQRFTMLVPIGFPTMPKGGGVKDEQSRPA